MKFWLFQSDGLKKKNNYYGYSFLGGKLTELHIVHPESHNIPYISDNVELDEAVEAWTDRS